MWVHIPPCEYAYHETLILKQIFENHFNQIWKTNSKIQAYKSQLALSV